MKRAKPASGRNTIRQRFLADATRELYERLGEADRRVEDGSVILRWDLGVGDGILVARKSTEEARNGETIGAQIQASVDYCDVAGHKPRIVVAVLNLSGQAHFENRHDFTEVFEAFVRGEASWVALGRERFTLRVRMSGTRSRCRTTFGSTTGTFALHSRAVATGPFYRSPSFIAHYWSRRCCRTRTSGEQHLMMTPT